MSHYAEPHSTVPKPGARGTSAWVGWVAFAGVTLFMLGSFHVIAGIVALVKDDYYLVASSGFLVNVDYSSWGWAHVVLGALVALAGIGVLAGQLWARVVGTVVALLSALINMAFLSAYPIWSVLMVALAVVVVMALTLHGSEIKAGE